MRVESRHTCPTCTMVTKNDTARRAGRHGTTRCEMPRSDMAHGTTATWTARDSRTQLATPRDTLQPRPRFTRWAMALMCCCCRH